LRVWELRLKKTQQILLPREDTPNININEIIDVCKEAKIELYFFTSPASTSVHLSKLE
jgi:hypothetical protein